MQPFVDVLQNRCSYERFRIILRKRPMLESLFDKVAGLKANIRQVYLHKASSSCYRNGQPAVRFSSRATND